MTKFTKDAGIFLLCLTAVYTGFWLSLIADSWLSRLFPWSSH